LPELPEVETVRRGLDHLYAGRTLRALEISGARTVRRHPPEHLQRLAGSVLVGAFRHGKYLLLHWSGGEILVVHLRMSGQLLAAPAGSPRPPHTHAVFSFAGQRELRFVDPRTFGELFLAGVQWTPTPASPSVSRGLPAELAHLGPDALRVGPSELAAAIAGRRAPLKALLTDQRLVAGVGNIYADEVCFWAGLRPQRPGGSLRPWDLRRLAASLRSVLEAAILARGSTLGDERYRDIEGAAGTYQFEHKVYGRAGEACTKCGQTVQKIKMGAKSAYFCPKCQR